MNTYWHILKGRTMNKTDIEYLDYTWNPISMRCTPKSTGCLHCWHLKVADRLAKNPKMPKEKRHAWAGGQYVLDKNELKAPSKKKKPSVIGVQFMGDLFHWSITYSDFNMIMNTIALSKEHTFIFLTKRPNQMKRHILQYYENQRFKDFSPLPNLWIGVSCSTQKDADDYIPIFLQIPAAKHIVSFEPLLSMIYIKDYPIIDWIICGCESGPKRRPTEIRWMESLKNQCGHYEIPFFLKQREIDGKVVSMPELSRVVWKQYPK